MTVSKTHLMRYTNLAAAIHTLRHKQLTLISPNQWVDRNDGFSMREYKSRAQLESLLAMCFTESFERFHYWKLFTSGMDGVSFEIKRTPLLTAFDRDPSLKHRQVIYSPIDRLEFRKPSLEQLPFLKRIQFQSEAEYRVVHCNRDDVLEVYGVPIEIDWITKIRLSPWLSPGLFESLIATLSSIEGCERLVIERSELLENERWKRALSLDDKA